jgi:hypothetical protein
MMLKNMRREPSYVAMAESDDKALVDTWKDDTEGIIIFVRHSGFISLCLSYGCSSGDDAASSLYIQLA